MTPWSAKQPTLVFRGHSYKGSVVLRIRVYELARLWPGLMDVNLAGLCSPDDPPECEKQHHFAFMSMEDMYKHKYVLDMDGIGATFRHRFLLLSGSLLFKIESNVTLWYFKYLQPMVHYIPVDHDNLEQDLPAKLQWAMEHDAEAEQIAINGKRRMLELLGRLGQEQLDTVRRFQAETGLDLRKHGRLGPGTAFCCEDLQDGDVMPWHGPALDSVLIVCQQSVHLNGPNCTGNPSRSGLPLINGKANSLIYAAGPCMNLTAHPYPYPPQPPLPWHTTLALSLKRSPSLWLVAVAGLAGLFAAALLLHFYLDDRGHAAWLRLRHQITQAL